MIPKYGLIVMRIGNRQQSHVLNAVNHPRLDSVPPRSQLQLAIETTGRYGSIALVDSHIPSAPVILEHHRLPQDVRTATSITRAIESLVAPHSIGFLSVACGPGSFTGLRIGVTTAKTLAFAWSIPLVSVDSLAAIASAAFSTNPNARRICVGIDAYRGQTYSGCFHQSDLEHQIPSDASKILTKEQWSQTLTSLDQETDLAGDPQCFADLPDRERRLLDRRIDAIGVAMIAHHAAWRNEFTEPLGLVPNYLKPSAAEENASR